jgi:hypothetical protein
LSQLVKRSMTAAGANSSSHSQARCGTRSGCGGCGSGTGMAGEAFGIRCATPAPFAWRFAFPPRYLSRKCETQPTLSVADVSGSASQVCGVSGESPETAGGSPALPVPFMHASAIRRRLSVIHFDQPASFRRQLRKKRHAIRHALLAIHFNQPASSRRRLRRAPCCAPLVTRPSQNDAARRWCGHLFPNGGSR